MSRTPPETFWERLKDPGVIPLLTQINENILALAHAFENVASLSTAGQGGAQTLLKSALPNRTVALPLNVHDILAAAIAAGDTGDLVVFDNDYNITVPAGSTSVQTFPTFGRPTSIIGDLSYVSDTVTFDGSLTIQVFIDGSPAAGPTATSALQVTTATKSFGIAQYAVAKTEVQIVVFNTTPGNVTLNFYGIQAVMSPTFYQSKVAPLLANYGFSALTALLGLT